MQWGNFLYPANDFLIGEIFLIPYLNIYTNGTNHGINDDIDKNDQFAPDPCSVCIVRVLLIVLKVACGEINCGLCVCVCVCYQRTVGVLTRRMCPLLSEWQSCVAMSVEGINFCEKKVSTMWIWGKLLWQTLISALSCFVQVAVLLIWRFNVQTFISLCF